MPDGAFTGYIDVAQVVLYVFWAFFFGLIFYLRREDRREGYPLEPDVPVGSSRSLGADLFPWNPPPKVFHRADGTTWQAPHDRPDTNRPLKVERTSVVPGASLEPSGDPMRDAVGPAAYVDREDRPEMALDGEPMILPMRVATDFAVEERDPDPRGMEVVGCDGTVGGTVTDIWVDRIEPQIRYLEVQPGGPAEPEPEPAPVATSSEEGEEGAPAPRPRRRAAKPKPVLLPIYYVSGINGRARRIRVESIRGDQFAGVPTLRQPNRLTKREEDQICAYFAGGHLYAEPERMGPLL